MNFPMHWASLWKAGPSCGTGSSALPDRAVHVWPVRISEQDEHVASLYALLADDEQQRAQRFAFPNLQRSYIVTRGMLRVLLSRYLETPPENISFIYGAKGKPAVAETRVRFNISHSGDLAVYAFTNDCEIGVDVEQIRPLPDMEDMARRFFCQTESLELAGVPEADRTRAFFSCWTRKEAYIKAVGDGLSIPLDSFAVTLRPDEGARLIHLENDTRAAAAWTIQNLELDPEYTAAVAYRDAERCVEISGLVKVPRPEALRS